MKIADITKERIEKYLEEGKRFDGRKPEDFREISVETGVSAKAEGSAKVKIGDTEVIAGIKMDVGEPYPDSQDKGNLMVTAELAPMSSDRFELGPPKIEAIELGRVMDRAVRESKLIDLEKLCIKVGEKVWTVFIDIYSLNDDGNLFDAAAIAALAALKNAKVPKYDDKEGKVLYGELSNKGVPLTKDAVITTTIHKIGDKLIVDPSREEEDASETRITISISETGSIHSMQKGNSQELSIDDFSKALDLAEKNYKSIFTKIKKELK